MKNILFISALILSIFLTLVTAPNAEKSSREDCIVEPMRKIKHDAFEEGERLAFNLKWGLVTAGYATMEIKEVIKINNREAYHIIVRSRSTSFMDHFYKVRDRIESYIDKESLCSLKFEKNLSEGRYQSQKSITYDQYKHTALYKDRVIEIPCYVQDVLSCLYYLRTHKLEVGKDFSFPVNSGEKNYDMIVKVLKKEEIEVPAGIYKTILVEPLLKYEGIFMQEGRLFVWLTDDARKIPVLMRSKIKVGSIHAELITDEKQKP